MEGQQQPRKMDGVQGGWIRKEDYFCEEGTKKVLFVSEIGFCCSRQNFIFCSMYL